MKKLIIIAGIIAGMASLAMAQGEEPVKMDAEAIYMKMCKKCHGEKGEGSEKATEKLCKGYTVEQLRIDVINGKSDDEVRKILLEGKEKMPGYAEKLTAEQIEEVLAYCRKLAADLGQP